jgi:hypothetical protein
MADCQKIPMASFVKEPVRKAELHRRFVWKKKKRKKSNKILFSLHQIFIYFTQNFIQLTTKIFIKKKNDSQANWWKIHKRLKKKRMKQNLRRGEERRWQKFKIFFFDRRRTAQRHLVKNVGVGTESGVGGPPSFGKIKITECATHKKNFDYLLCPNKQKERCCKKNELNQKWAGEKNKFDKKKWIN